MLATSPPSRLASVKPRWSTRTHRRQINLPLSLAAMRRHAISFFFCSPLSCHLTTHRFDASDLDRDRQMDFREFSKMVREREMAIHTEDALRRRFEDMDSDGSGFIDMSEYIKFALRDALARSAAQIQDLLSSWDKDGNGLVNREEFRRAIGSFGFDVKAEEIDAIFDELDFNQTGTLDLRNLKQKLFEKGPAIGSDGTAGPVDPRNALRPTDWREGTAAANRSIEGMKKSMDGKSGAFKDAGEVAKQLRTALADSATRLLDLFRAWDDNGDGLISKKEFRAAVVALGFKEVPKSECDALFDMFDKDHSGVIDYKEMSKALRPKQHRASSEGAPGPAPAPAPKPQTPEVVEKSKVLRGTTLTVDSELDLVSQLTSALAANWGKVTTLFVEWDADGSGAISRQELRKAMAALGMTSSRESEKAIDNLFERLDADGNGEISYEELAAAVRPAHARRAEQIGDPRQRVLVRAPPPRVVRVGRGVGGQFLPGDIPPEFPRYGTNPAVDAPAQAPSAATTMRIQVENPPQTAPSKPTAARGVTSPRYLLPITVQSPRLATAGEIAAQQSSRPMTSGSDQEWFSREKDNLRPPSAIIKAAGGPAYAARAPAAAIATGAAPAGPPPTAVKEEEEGEFLSFEAFCDLMANSSHEALSTKELAKRFKDLDVNGDGIVSRHEFIRFSLIDALAASRKRVLDMLREWDTDGNNTVDKKEFRKAVKAMGFDFCTKEDIDAVFNSLDDDGSGTLEFKELNGQLRPSTVARNRFQLRKQATGRLGNRIGTMQKIEPTAEMGVAEQLREILMINRARVIDLFKEWDADHDGLVDPIEFRDAIRTLGYDAPKAEIDELYNSFDLDGSGSLEFSELNKLLRQRSPTRGAPGSPRTPRSGTIEEESFVMRPDWLPRESGLPSRPRSVTESATRSHRGGLPSPRTGDNQQLDVRVPTPAQLLSPRGLRSRPSTSASVSVSGSGVMGAAMMMGVNPEELIASKLPPSYAMQSSVRSTSPRDWRPGIGARSAVREVVFAAREAEEEIAFIANNTLDDDIDGFEGRLPAHVQRLVDRKVRKPTGEREEAHPPLPPPIDEEPEASWVASAYSEAYTANSSTYGAGGAPAPAGELLQMYADHYGSAVSSIAAPAQAAAQEESFEVTPVVLPPPNAAPQLSMTQQRAVAPAASCAPRMVVVVPAENRAIPPYGGRFPVPPPTNKPAYAPISEALTQLQSGYQKRWHEQTALTHRLASFERADKRRVELKDRRQRGDLQRQLLYAMRAPNVFSSTAPASARASSRSGMPSADGLAATLAGLTGKPISARGPPNPSLLLQAGSRGMQPRPVSFAPRVL